LEGILKKKMKKQYKIYEITRIDENKNMIVGKYIRVNNRYVPIFFMQDKKIFLESSEIKDIGEIGEVTLEDKNDKKLH